MRLIFEGYHACKVEPSLSEPNTELALGEKSASSYFLKF